MSLKEGWRTLLTPALTSIQYSPLITHYPSLNTQNERQIDYENTSTVRLDYGGRDDALPCLDPVCARADRPAALAAAVASRRRSTGRHRRASSATFPARPRIQLAVVRDAFRRPRRHRT